MNCNVFLHGAEGSPGVLTEGELEIYGNGFYLKYTIDGDDCALHAKGGTVTQSRRGRVNTDITFRRGKRTVCMLLSGELTGSIPVDTGEMEVVTGGHGAELFINYRLGGAAVQLNLKALFKAD